MIYKNVIIFKSKYLFEILKELDAEIKINFIEISNEKSLREIIRNLNNYIIVTNKAISNLENQLLLTSFPIKISKLNETINVELMKKHFSDHSKIKIKNYVINLNSREISKNDIQMKLTEKEINTIMYLSKNNTPISIAELEKKVWMYEAEIETHTVETHIYRLRKKIQKIFNDENFITSKKNGYEIN
tara:strand:- start:119 stop:682 length:564 start_codon:yes stop_codon:yes gene_type:complete